SACLPLSLSLSRRFAVCPYTTLFRSTCILCRQILVWMDTPSDIIDGAYSYIFIIFVGIPVIYLYNLLSAIIRSLGDSKSPLIFRSEEHTSELQSRFELVFGVLRARTL